MASLGEAQGSSIVLMARELVCSDYGSVLDGRLKNVGPWRFLGFHRLFGFHSSFSILGTIQGYFEFRARETRTLGVYLLLT